MIYKVAYAVIGHREREVVGRILEDLWGAYRTGNAPNENSDRTKSTIIHERSLLLFDSGYKIGDRT